MSAPVFAVRRCTLAVQGVRDMICFLSQYGLRISTQSCAFSTWGLGAKCPALDPSGGTISKNRRLPQTCKTRQKSNTPPHVWRETLLKTTLPPHALALTSGDSPDVTAFSQQLPSSVVKSRAVAALQVPGDRPAHDMAAVRPGVVLFANLGEDNRATLHSCRRCRRWWRYGRCRRRLYWYCNWFYSFKYLVTCSSL